MDKPIGEITHYYNKIGVAIINLNEPLAIGETIKIVGHGKEFTQKVESMEIEHQSVQKAKKGDVVGLKVNQQVKEKDKIFRV